MPPFLPLLLLLHLFLLPSSTLADGCPENCSCQGQGSIFCIQRRSSVVPRGLPSSTQQLYVFQNGIDVLAQDDFAGLGSLEMLDLSQNELAEIPDGVFSPLSSLRNLDLSSNGIAFISRGSFSGLVQLERLYLHANSIQSIQTDAFDDLTGLLELKLQGNRLTSLPALRLPRLLLLDLSHNDLPALGPRDLQTPHLESLKVASLGLTSLDEELMASLGNLHDLDVSQNKLEELPRGLWAARGLIKLSLAANPLRDLGEHGLHKMAALQELDLSSLNIYELPQAFLLLFPRLAVLTAAENPFNCFCPLAWLPGWLKERGVTLARTEETRCHFPPVNAGKMLAELDHQDFGCPPTTTILTSSPSGVGAGGGTSPPPPTTSPEATHTNAIPPPPLPSEEAPSAETDRPDGTLYLPAPSPAGREEDRDGNICPPNICLNGGTCRFDPLGQLACICPDGTSGLYCENLEEEEPEVDVETEEHHNHLPHEDPIVASVAAPVVTADHDDISSRQVTSTSILLDLHRFIETRPHIRGIKLTYRNLSGPDLRPMYLSVPASYPQYTLRGLRPNCTYSVCASPLGERGGSGGSASDGARGSCMEARTGPVSASSSEPRVEGQNQLTYTLIPAVAAVALVLGVALVAGAVLFLRRRRAKARAHSDELDLAEPGPLELEGVKTSCLENGNGGTPGPKQTEAERSHSPTPQNGGLDYEVPLMQGQGQCSSNNNVEATKPSYF